jgi:hypothetical protein
MKGAARCRSPKQQSEPTNRKGNRAGRASGERRPHLPRRPDPGKRLGREQAGGVGTVLGNGGGNETLRDQARELETEKTT